MKGIVKKLLAVVLAAAMLFCVMPDIAMVAKADPEPTIEFNQGDRENLFEINSANLARYDNMSSVTIPAGKTLVVSGVTWHVGTLTIEFDSSEDMGGSLNIFEDDGAIVCSNWSVSAGSTLRVGTAVNATNSGITLKNEDGSANFDGEISWETEFVFDNNMWKLLPSGPFGPGDNQFAVDFDDRFDPGLDSPQAGVKVNGVNVNPWDVSDFVVGTPIDFTLECAEGSEGVEVRIEVYDNVPFTEYSSGNGDITINTSTNTFSFTPRSESPFMVFVSWANSEPNGGPQDQLNWGRLQEEMSATYFAFGNISDGNSSGTADTYDLKYGVARTLYDGFKVQEGRYQREGATLGLVKQDGDSDTANFNANMTKLMSLMQVGNDGNPLSETISVKNKAGSSFTLESYEINMVINELYGMTEAGLADITGGTTPLEHPIVISTKVYLIDETNFPAKSSEQVIIKAGSNYFIRNAYIEGRADDLENIPGANARALVIVSDFNSKNDIVAFGNFAFASEEFSDESTSDMYSSGLCVDKRDQKYLGDKFVVMKPSFTGATITGAGEANEALAWSATGSYNVVESNGTQEVEQELYFGFTSAKINAITSADVVGLGVTGIDSISVVGNIPTNAVSVIQPTDPTADATVEFHSDYYDTVKLKIVYNLSGGGQKEAYTTIHRVGIVIDGGRTNGFDKTYAIHHGHDDGGIISATGGIVNVPSSAGTYGSAVYATYYYPTASASASPNVSLFATITYVDGTVEREVIPTTKFTEAADGHTAMSDYIIHVGQIGDSNYPVKVEAIAVPNAEGGRFVGAKLGAGKGVRKTFDWSL